MLARSSSTGLNMFNQEKKEILRSSNDDNSNINDYV